jgi:voltage-gated potassium channel Kch
MTMSALLALAVGVILLALVLQDAFEVMLLPRRVARTWRLARLYFRATWPVWALLARLIPGIPRRERFLSIYGPLAMMLLFSLWAATLIAAFGLIEWALQAGVHGKAASDFGEQLYMSGVTFFTLGFGDVVPHTPLGRVVVVFEAGTGFGLMAVVIGYLPVLYQLFSRREAHVIQLDGRAGSPPTAVEILKRHSESGGLDDIDELLRTWEIWGADLLESHLSYPMLAFYRSQHDDQSWLGALAAIMDLCALILIGVADVKPLQARMTFAMARHVVVEMARSLRVSAGPAPDEPRLAAGELEKLLAAFETAGLTWNGGEEAEQVLAAVRATYEPMLAALADYLLIDLPGWSPSEDQVDHWERGPRGIIARRLIGGLADGSISEEAAQRDRRAGRSWVGRVRRKPKG